MNSEEKEKKEDEKSIEELMAQKMNERNNMFDGMDYVTETYNNLPEFDVTKQKNLNTFSNTYNAEIPDEWLKKKKDEPEFFIEFENKERIQIEMNGMLECNPPILKFLNEYDNTTIPYEWIEDKNVKLLIKIKDKEFTYIFDEQYLYTANIGVEDERLKEMRELIGNVICTKTETLFVALTMSGFYDNIKVKDDTHRKLIFAYHGDKVVFRQGSFRMIFDDTYNEMYPNKK